MKWEKLFTPISIGTMRARNRLVMSPMGTNYADKQGLVTPRMIAYYAARAKGGVGTITTGNVVVSSATGKGTIYELAANRDECLPGLSELAKAINECDCRSVMQLHHAGRRAASKLNNGVLPVAASPIPCVGGEIPRELTIAEIEGIVEDFGNAARRARKAGFSAVELHGAHGYLIAGFLSPISNKRTDKYGGTLENRTRFVTEIVKCIKEKAGADYPVLIKISVDEHLPGGNTPPDAQRIARILQEAGFSAITASAGHTAAAPEGYAWSLPGSYMPRGCHVPLAQALKEVLSIPVGAVGRINDPVLADSILKENKADLIYMGRPLLADPELPAKAERGDVEDIRTCLGCSMCQKSFQPFVPETNLSCAINAELGKEAAFAVVPATRSKKVLVVGGGPAGMEAARVAALRGHQVTLYEKSKKLGGQLLPASIPPHKDEIPHLVDYLATQMRKLKVNVNLGKKATAATVKRLKPDVIVLATGAYPGVPEIPGIHNENVVIAEDVLAGKAKLKDPVVIMGGGIVGCETGELLAQKGMKVTIVKRRPNIAEGLEHTARILLEKRLRDYGVSILTGARVQQITPEGVVLENGEKIKAGSVVLAAGAVADTALLQSLNGVAGEIYTIGDCVKPRMIMDAIREGAEIGRQI
ncbi:MAG: FAD-dependent oxidoreductase [Dehalococcoidales bacterium]|nr:FAD-dependent oxidoreductase [Dehalococcoidales bacterium]